MCPLQKQTRLTSVSFYCRTNDTQQHTRAYIGGDTGHTHTHMHTQAEVTVNLLSAFIPSWTVLPPGPQEQWAAFRRPGEVCSPFHPVFYCRCYAWPSLVRDEH